MNDTRRNKVRPVNDPSQYGALTFDLTADHVALVRRLNVRADWYPYVDAKRPFGNSDVVGDIIDICGWTLPAHVPVRHPDDPYEEIREHFGQRAGDIECEVPIALEVILAAGSFEPGRYVRTTEYFTDWRPAPSGDVRGEAK